jgi:hypothetical protein
VKVGPLQLMEGFLSLGPEATLESVEPAADVLFLMHRNVNWWIGDLVNFGEARWGDDIWQAIPDTVSERFIGRVVAHAKKYRPTERVIGASWTMHSMVAKLHPDDRRRLLRQAVDERMDTVGFTELVKSSR